jgi:hypothetical protein
MDLNTKREGNDSSRFTDRKLVANNVKGLSRKKKVDSTPPGLIGPGNTIGKLSAKPQSHYSDKSKKDADEVNEIGDS